MTTLNSQFKDAKNHKNLYKIGIEFSSQMRTLILVSKVLGIWKTFKRMKWNYQVKNRPFFLFQRFQEFKKSFKKVNVGNLILTFEWKKVKTFWAFKKINLDDNFISRSTFHAFHLSCKCTISENFLNITVLIFLYICTFSYVDAFIFT